MLLVGSLLRNRGLRISRGLSLRLLLGRQTSRLTSLTLGAGLGATTALLGLGMHLLALRREGHDDVATLLLRLGLNGAEFLDIVGQTLQQFHTTDRARDLTTAQHDGDFDLVASVEEAGHMALLHVEIVVVDLLALRADQAYLRDANLVVNAWFVADDDSNPLLQFLGQGSLMKCNQRSMVHGKPEHTHSRICTQTYRHS